MNYDLVISGVGGQGVLSIAWVIDHAVNQIGWHLKQSEVHGMAQRGGAVSAFVRISDQPLASDLIADGCADMVLAVEPLEALRYTRLLKPTGWIITDITCLVNIADYPAASALYPVLFSAPHLVALDATRLAKKAGNVKAQNMVVLGAAAAQLPLPTELLESQIATLFASKSERVIKANINAFRKGLAAGAFARAMRASEVAPEVVARLVARLHFPPHPVPAELLEGWRRWLTWADAPRAAQKIFAADEPVELEVVRTLLSLGVA